MSAKFLALTATVAAVLSVCDAASAQEIPIVQAGAGGRFETQIDGKARVEGFQSSQVAAFRGRIEGLTSMFAAIPQVNAPTDPVCRRVYSFIESAPPPARGMLTAEVGVMTPINVQNGRCNRMTGGGIVLWLNRIDEVVIDGGHAVVRGAENGARDWFTPRFVSKAPDRIVLDNGVTVLTRSDRPLYLPVSLERYMQEKIRTSGESQAGGHLARFRAEELPGLRANSAELLESMKSWATAAQIAETRRMHEEAWRITEEAYAKMDADAGAAQSGGRTWSARLAALTPAQRQGQACLSDRTGEPSTAPGCSDGVYVWELNPDYFDRSRPSDIQSIVIQVDQDPYFGENALQYSTRREIMRDMDLSAFRPR